MWLYQVVHPVGGWQVRDEKQRSPAFSLPSWKVVLGSVPSRPAAEPVTGSAQAEIPLEFGVLGNGICKKGG